MLANGGNTEGLFRAAFMQSGSPTPVGDITHGQRYYDTVVDEVGCSTASDSLVCLRTVDYAALHRAMDNSPGIYSYQVYSSAVFHISDKLYDDAPLVFDVGLASEGGWRVSHRYATTVGSGWKCCEDSYRHWYVSLQR